MSDTIDNYMQLAINATLHGHKELIDYLDEKYGPLDYNFIARVAAIHGYIDIVDDMIEKGANEYLDIGYNAFASGHKKIAEKMFEKYAENY